MTVFNTTTKKECELDLTQEYDTDQTQQFLENIDDFHSYATFDNDRLVWCMADDDYQWWKNLEAKNAEFAGLLKDNGISVASFRSWLEEMGLEISYDIETSFSDNVDFLKEMIAEKK